LMSTGLTFGTISALYGFSHGIVDRAQYSFLVAALIASALVPTMIANFSFLPRHLLPAPEPSAVPAGIEPIPGEEDAGLADE
jgi:glutathione-regulated potassium-efflux system ancillary protein KefC